MSKPGILYDLTYFVNDPVRTGIQRVAFEIARHWKARTPLVPAMVSPEGGMYRLPNALFPLIEWFFQAKPANLEPLAKRIRSLVAPALRGPRVAVEEYPALLNAEVFAEMHRAAFYQGLFDQGLADRVFFIVYDLLPFLHPDWFLPRTGQIMLPYARIIRQARYTAFISTKTREDYTQRLVRDESVDGPVLALGSDGLGTAAPSFDPRRRGFTVVGTLEPRKNHAAILEAFKRLWLEGVEVDLTFIGRLGWLQEEVVEHIQALARVQKRFRWLDSLDDDTLRTTIRESRATLFVSRAEGYGLPPVESLALGVPVVVTADLPSVRDLPPLGQLRIADPTPDAIRQAVLLMLQDHVAAQKYAEIPGLNLPRWHELPVAIAPWIGAHRRDADLQLMPTANSSRPAGNWMERTARRLFPMVSRST